MAVAIGDVHRLSDAITSISPSRPRDDLTLCPLSRLPGLLLQTSYLVNYSLTFEPSAQDPWQYATSRPDWTRHPPTPSAVKPLSNPYGLYETIAVANT
ncbi:hypothetical protein CYLTODRAFT_416656 [Cylindrobasidium torrendii FP15055 ss-10]|uniref:Uncharacterized protein n=1 Tax=Cylindrobasidium torrendii FP15055 ss-10 TaxID=1314674 RepID=A0A0D7BUT3_9AGAR|nr:hypothetical protein CYLTODRAFT_416656 [Cylindrobasidium torrendii FP15055 ss-10]